MYTSFEITNFRCFEHLKLDNLARVNLIAGKNNVGKTALLEAVYLHSKAYDPQYVLQVDSSRGIDRDLQHFSGDRWDWIFHQFNTSESAELVSEHIKAGRRSLKLRIVREQKELTEVMLNIRERGIAKVTALFDTTPMLALDYHENVYNQKGTIYLIHPTTIYPVPPPPPFPMAYVLSQGRSSAQENASRFTNLIVAQRQNWLLDSLTILEPRLKSLALLIYEGETLIHGDVGTGRPIPLAYMGEGMNRLTNLLLSTSDNQNGVVLIDEIENGLHYSVMQDVWKAIGHAAREFNTQIFATTHSWECITAAHRAFSENGIYDFAYHRLERAKTGEIRVVDYDEDTLGTSIELGYEGR